MPDFRGATAEIRYGAGYATILVFRFWFDAPDGYSEPRLDANVRANTTGSRIVGVTYGHDQKLVGWVRRIPKADLVEGARTISGWPAWRTFLHYGWTLQPWRWVYEAGTYNAGDPDTFFDAELETPGPEWEEGPELEGNGQRRVELTIVRVNGTLDTGLAVEGY